MRIEEMGLPGVLKINPTIFEDERGAFFESFKKSSLSRFGVHTEFVQDNHSLNLKKGTIRGMHFQEGPGQAKLVRCIAGSILDVAVSLDTARGGAQKYVTQVLSGENQGQLFIPEGYAHGFITLEDNTEVLYKCSTEYDSHLETEIAWNDPDFNIDWPLLDGAPPILSDRDKNAQSFQEWKSKQDKSLLEEGFYEVEKFFGARPEVAYHDGKGRWVRVGKEEIYLKSAFHRIGNKIK